MVELNNLENIKKLRDNLENNWRGKSGCWGCSFFMYFGEIKKFFKKFLKFYFPTYQLLMYLSLDRYRTS